MEKTTHQKESNIGSQGMKRIIMQKHQKKKQKKRTTPKAKGRNTKAPCHQTSEGAIKPPKARTHDKPPQRRWPSNFFFFFICDHPAGDILKTKKV